MTNSKQTSKTEDAEKTSAAAEKSAGPRWVNRTVGVINYRGQTVAPGGVLKLDEVSETDKGLQHLISTKGLELVK